jgi:SAM-dependent methyltransferase
MSVDAVQNSWFDGPAGRRVLEAEVRLLEAAYATLFGYWIVQLGTWGRDLELLSDSKIRGRALITEDAGVGGVASAAHALALSSDSIDAVLLPHTLETSPEPHAVLRETERVLVGEGHALIFGFSPWSAWGVRRRFAEPGDRPWRGRYISEYRLTDWLRLLGFEIVRTEHYLHGLPSEHPAVLRRLEFTAAIGRRCWPGFAGGYFIIARKRVSALTPLKLAHRRRKKALVGGLVKPTTHSPPCHG